MDPVLPDKGFLHTLGLEFTVTELGHVEALMPVTEKLLQPFGYLHGGATISLLEAAASMGARLGLDLDTYRAFGIDVHVRHRKSCRGGVVRGVAILDHEEPSQTNGYKQFWTVTAYNDNDQVLSEGVIVTKTVTLAYLAEKNG